MELPVPLALAQAVPRLPHDGPGVWWYEPKFDGHRMIMERTAESVRLYARSGRVVTSPWMDLAVAGMRLLPGTVLDGEAVIWNAGKLDFAAAQARAASTVDRARALAERLPASYVVWDLLAHPVLGDVRGRRYTERRRLLLDVLADVVRRSSRCRPPTTTTPPPPGTRPCARKGSRGSWPSGPRAFTRAAGSGSRSGTRRR
ncbi:hypothetical protein [Streptomyces sp. NPDC051909]|uniref:ATP-dependent DNA ligase n=1 Tax=Streptomyces sp. NPDC051909 TaxID=3154944 RepID=UPI003437DB29